MLGNRGIRDDQRETDRFQRSWVSLSEQRDDITESDS